VIRYAEKDDCLTLAVRVIPKSSKSEIVGEHEFPVTEPIGWSKMIFLLEKK